MTNASSLVRDNRFEPQRWIEPAQVTLFPLSELWAMLASGAIGLVDSQYSEQRCFATLQARPHGNRPPPARLRILERVLLGERQKSIAIDLGVSGSTIADCDLPPCLTQIEKTVVRLMVEGRTHLEIAAQRRVSPRAIANQLASIFRKLGPSGRSELVSHLVRRSSTSA